MKREIKTKFYRFFQTNSGGRFIFNAAQGISTEVWIEAMDAAHANSRAEELGIYFDGCEEGRDCSCCGDRWDRADERWTHTTQEEPTTANQFGIGWAPEDMAEGYLHRMDGTIVPLKKKPLED